jgi:hypothetical protein
MREERGVMELDARARIAEVPARLRREDPRSDLEITEKFFGHHRAHTKLCRTMLERAYARGYFRGEPLDSRGRTRALEDLDTYPERAARAEIDLALARAAEQRGLTTGAA